MKLKNFNNLLDLFFDQYNKQDKNKIFLTNLGNPKHKLSWEKTYLIVNHLSNNISKLQSFLLLITKETVAVLTLHFLAISFNVIFFFKIYTSMLFFNLKDFIHAKANCNARFPLYA